MKKPKENILYGVNPIYEALGSTRVEIEKIYVSKGGAKGRLGTILRKAREKDVPVSHVPIDVLRKISGTEKNQGIAASLSASHYSSKEEILGSVDDDSILLILDGIEDPGNFGAIIRTAVATGISGIFIPSRGAVGMTHIAAKRSAGAIVHAEIARVKSLISLANEIKAKNFFLVALSKGGEKSIYEIQYRLPLAIILGSEKKGIKRELREKVDEIVSIPMTAKVESLNVSVSAGIVLYEVLRRRASGKGNDECMPRSWMKGKVP